MDAVKATAMQNTNLLKILKTHIAMNIECDDNEDRIIEIKVRLAEIDLKFKKILSTLSVDLESNTYAESAIADLMLEKRSLENELNQYTGNESKSSTESKLSEIEHIAHIIEKQPLRYDDVLIRQILECVVVQSKTQIKIVFKDGTEVEQSLD